MSSEFQVPICLLLHHDHKVVPPGMGLVCRPGQARPEGKNTEAVCPCFCPLGILLPLTQTRKEVLLNFYLYLLQFQEKAIFESKSGPTEVKRKLATQSQIVHSSSSDFFPQLLLANIYFSDAPDSQLLHSICTGILVAFSRWSQSGVCLLHLNRN